MFFSHNPSGVLQVYPQIYYRKEDDYEKKVEFIVNRYALIIRLHQGGASDSGGASG